MDDVKSNRGGILKFLVIFLFLVSLCLIGYIIFSKYDGDEVDCLVNENDNGLLDLSKLSDFVSYDDSYASIRELKFYDEDMVEYSLMLDLEGKVYTDKFGDRQEIINVNNVVDIVPLYSATGMLEDNYCYMLTSDGFVYVYSLGDMVLSKFEAAKLENVSNVIKILDFNYYKTEGGSSSWGILAVLNNGEYVRLEEVSG